MDYQIVYTATRAIERLLEILNVPKPERIEALRVLLTDVSAEHWPEQFSNKEASVIHPLVSSDHGG
jgi:hypothetical protein